ncbi:hypothetical protein ACP70R_036678 [Stipagrostis hirtigluma subsp. patula]
MAAAGQGGAEAFRPDDHELVDLFLRRKLAGEPLPAGVASFIHDVDVRSAAPGDLVGTFAPASGAAADRPVWYFLSPVRYGSGRRSSSLLVGGRRSSSLLMKDDKKSPRQSKVPGFGARPSQH